jgi:hypothetical protein
LKSEEHDSAPDVNIEDVEDFVGSGSSGEKEKR